MAKKVKRQPRMSAAEREQRETVDLLSKELMDLHAISIVEMAERGILPPLYSGEHLGERREAVALWAMVNKPELGALLLQIHPDVETQVDLQAERDDIGLANDWPVSELLDIMVTPEGKPLIENSDSLRDMSMLFVLFSTQIKPAPGYDSEQMLDSIAEMRPFAVFVKIPVTGEGESLNYQWDDVENYSAEIVYAESPQLLEAAVWEYRLNLALEAERIAIIADEEDPNELMLGQTIADYAAIYDMLALDCVRIYGTTSAVKAKQEEFDVLRTEDGDLIVNLPLKPSVEPNKMLAEARLDFIADEVDDIEFLRLPANGDVLRQVWPTIRAHNFFMIRMRSGQYVARPDGYMQLKGFMKESILEWYMADTTGELYAMARLISIYEMLGGCQIILGKLRV